MYSVCKQISDCTYMYMVGHFCNGLKFLTYANSEDPDQRSSD